jgi:hypothetical protein
MANFSARPTTATIKRTILRTIQGLVSKSVYRAIELILSPCCHPVVKSVSAECVGFGGYNTQITVQLVNSINLYGAGQGSIFLWVPDLNIFIGSKTIYTDSNTLVFQFINPGAFGIFDASVELYMPTSSDGLVGISLSTEDFEIDIPECVIPDCNCYQLINANVPGAPADYSYDSCDTEIINGTLPPQSQTVICARTISATSSKSIQIIELDACDDTPCLTPVQTCVQYSISNPTEEPLDASYVFCGDISRTTTTINGGDLLIVCVELGSLSEDPGLVVLVTGVGCSAS